VIAAALLARKYFRTEHDLIATGSLVFVLAEVNPTERFFDCSVLASHLGVTSFTPSDD
jgi:hypothetical protein